MRNLNNWLTDNYGLLIEPDDGRWHAILSSYDDEEKFIGIGSFPSSAVEDALAKAEATGKHPREFQALQDLDSDDADSWVCASCDIPAALDNGKPVCLKCGNDTDFKRADTDDIGVCPDECNFDLCPICLKLERNLVEKVPKGSVMGIEFQQDSLCTKCQGKLKKGSKGKWVRASKDHDGGLFHNHCVKETETEQTPVSKTDAECGMTPVKLPKGTMSIVIQQLTLCKACGGDMPKGSHGWWVRATGDKDGGLYHKDCAEVE